MRKTPKSDRGPPPQNLLSVGEAGERLQVSPGTVRNWISKGYIRAVRLPSGHRKVFEHEISTLLGEMFEQQAPAVNSGGSARRPRATPGVEETVKSDLVDQLRRKRKQILEIAGRHGARNIRVFGSVARGEGTEESDFDFLAEFEKGRSLFDEIGLIQDLEDLLGRKVHVVTPAALHRVIRDEVLTEAVPL